VWTLPNLLSIFRIALVPLLVYLLSYSDPVSSAVAASVFLLGSITDYLDGYLARRNQSVSELGKILDPIADKVFVVAALIMLAAMERSRAGVPAWLVVVIVARETAVTLIRGIALTEGIVMEAEDGGKYKLLLQVFALSALILHYPYGGIDFYAAGMYFLVVATVMAVWSGIQVHLRFLCLLREKKALPSPLKIDKRADLR
jgi:CDP-diacylglycerol--glycerol-3-phosphate 3-phosphatidyltransferase